MGVLPRLRLAARVVAGPLLDFARAYCCCEAANAYLMHRWGVAWRVEGLGVVWCGGVGGVGAGWECGLVGGWG